MHDTQFRLLQSVLTQMGADMTKICTSMTQLVSVQLQRLQVEKQMTIDIAVLKSILDSANTALLAEAAQIEVIKANNEQIAALLAQVGPVPPDVQASIDSFLANAAAANPPPNPVPVPDPAAPVDPNA